MNDGLQTTAELNNQIYESAMRTGSSYQETANLVAQLGNLAGEAFSSSGEIVAFAEQLNKQIVLSGASSQAASAAIYQLTQGLSSGALRGEELNSVLEQTPMIGKTIADYLGVSTGEMRQLASEGKLTADVVKTALLSSAQETNAAFEKMPMTWGRLWNNAKTAALQAFQPVLEAVGEMAGFVEEHGDMIVTMIIAMAAAWGVYTAATWAADSATKAFFATLLSNPLTWILVLIGAVIALIYGAINSLNEATGATVSATGVITGAVAAAASFVENLFVGLWNFLTGIFVAFYNLVATVANFFANVFRHPIQAVVRLFAGLADSVLGILEAIASAMDAVFGSSLADHVSGWRAGLDDWVKQATGDQYEEVVAKLDPEMFRADRFDYGEAFDKWYAWGADKAGDTSSLSGSALSPWALSQQTPDYTSQLTSIEAAIGGVNKSVDMGAEDLRSMVDVAERQYVNRINLTAQSPVINVNGQNTGSTAADRQNLGRVIRDILREETASGSTRQTYQPA